MTWGQRRRPFPKNKVGRCWRCRRTRQRVHYQGAARVFLCDQCRAEVSTAA